MEQTIPGFTLRWQDIEWDTWRVLYDNYRELFIHFHVPVQRYIWWRFNFAKSSQWRAQEFAL